MTRNKEYDATITGGNAYPRVTGCESTYRAFRTLEAAHDQMRKWKVSKYDEIIKDRHEKATSLREFEAFYAVTHRKYPGIYPYWDGETKSDRTCTQAEVLSKIASSRIQKPTQWC
ncbi:hypothetical protein PGQ11_007954 [Apiospora arundinis]|uniref:Uncharacterized protein n=1 Tax=Apiospora arundinis TaxID=335852 RepID=A0ABR2IX23_9PEZI